MLLLSTRRAKLTPIRMCAKSDSGECRHQCNRTFRCLHVTRNSTNPHCHRSALSILFAYLDKYLLAMGLGSDGDVVGTSQRLLYFPVSKRYTGSWNTTSVRASLWG
jgi:hypothetical protein